MFIGVGSGYGRSDGGESYITVNGGYLQGGGGGSQGGAGGGCGSCGSSGYGGYVSHSGQARDANPSIGPSEETIRANRLADIASIEAPAQALNPKFPANEVFPRGINIPGPGQLARAGLNYFRSDDLIGPTNPGNQFAKKMLSLVDLLGSVRGLAKIPATSQVGIGKIFNSQNASLKVFQQFNDAEGACGTCIVQDGLFALTAYMSSQPILGGIGIFSIGFEAGDLLSRLRVPFTENSRFGDIFGDLINNRDNINFRS